MRIAFIANRVHFPSRFVFSKILRFVALFYVLCLTLFIAVSPYPNFYEIFVLILFLAFVFYESIWLPFFSKILFEKQQKFFKNQLTLIFIAIFINIEYSYQVYNLSNFKHTYILSVVYLCENRYKPDEIVETSAYHELKLRWFYKYIKTPKILSIFLNSQNFIIVPKKYCSSEEQYEKICHMIAKFPQGY